MRPVQTRRQTMRVMVLVKAADDNAAAWQNSASGHQKQIIERIVRNMRLDMIVRTPLQSP
jgi:hypothetical protein